MPPKTNITYEIVKEFLESQITGNGDKMPTRAEICKALKTSATTIAPFIKQFKQERNLTNHWNNAAETTEARLRNEISALKNKNKILKNLIEKLLSKLSEKSQHTPD